MFLYTMIMSARDCSRGAAREREGGIDGQAKGDEGGEGKEERVAYWIMRGFIIDMNECTFYVGQHFKLIL